MNITTLWIDKLAMRRFKKQVRTKYPREVYGVLLGVRKNQYTFDVHDIWVPPPVASTYEYVIPDYPTIEKMVAESRYDYIGSIHSHPQAAPTLSKHDVKQWDKDDIVIGVMSIRKRKKYCTTELQVWRKGTPLAVEVKYFQWTYDQR
jgi:proteasome lid subunit RPN8/RPN11